jgi:hypothetical protein
MFAKRPAIKASKTMIPMDVELASADAVDNKI